MLAAALLIYVFIAAILLISSAMVLYHFYHFRIGNSYQILITVFVIGSLVFFAAGFLAFASIDWGLILEFIKRNDIIPF